MAPYAVKRRRKIQSAPILMPSKPAVTGSGTAWTEIVESPPLVEICVKLRLFVDFYGLSFNPVFVV